MVNSVARQVQAEREEAQSWKISVHLSQVFVLADPLGAIGSGTFAQTGFT